MQSAEEILASHPEPQPILPGCFAGCKGDLANRFLYKLVQGYGMHGERLFDYEKYRLLADQALIALERSSLII